MGIRRTALVAISRRFTGRILENLESCALQLFSQRVLFQELDVTLIGLIHCLGFGEEHRLLVRAVLRRVDIKIPGAFDASVAGVVPGFVLAEDILDCLVSLLHLRVRRPKRRIHRVHRSLHVFSQHPKLGVVVQVGELPKAGKPNSALGIR